MGQKQILVVEDDDNVRELLKDLLEAVHHVREARSATEALTILKGEEIALIVLDYRLPDRTGLEVLADIKEAWPSLPVIMITGYGSEWLCTSAFRLGVRDYFAKPFDAREFTHTVCRILSVPVPTRVKGDCSRIVGGHWDLPAGRDDVAVLQCVKLIQKCYWGRVALSQLACELGIGKYTLSRRFRQVMGVSLRDYLIRFRLEKAKALLRTRDFSITEVAQMVGFGDLPRFDKLFKRHAAVTPSVYRTQTLVSGNKGNEA